MRNLIGIPLAMFLASVTANAQDHIPVPHTIPHGTSRICWGYAMGRAAGRLEGNATCDPATLIPANEGIDQAYFRLLDWSHVDSLLSGDILYWPGTHAAYVTGVSRDGQQNVIVDSISVAHMSASGWEGVIYEKLAFAKTRVGVGNPSSFCRRKNISVTAQNLFYSGANALTDQGLITLSGSTGASPRTVSLDWAISHTAAAINNQDWPTGYRQIFNTQVGWTQGGSPKGTTLQISIKVEASSPPYQANFYQAEPVTFTPSGGGGGITVDGQTRYTTYTKYARINPPPAEQVSATAVNTSANRVDYLFSNWTNSANSDTSYNYSISFYPTGAVTYTAHFNGRPEPPANVSAGGNVGNPVEVTWSEHPHEGVTQYQIWRKVKHSQTGTWSGPDLLATVNRGTTSYTDYSYIVTSGYTHDLASYDVRSYFSVNGTYSDPNWVSVYAQQDIGPRAGDSQLAALSTLKELPQQYTLGNYPNPFNPSTTIRFSLPEMSLVRLRVFDMLGRQIAVLVEEEKPAGTHAVIFNASNLTSGTYFYRIEAGSFVETKRMVLLK